MTANLFLKKIHTHTHTHTHNKTTKGHVDRSKSIQGIEDLSSDPFKDTEDRIPIDDIVNKIATIETNWKERVRAMSDLTHYLTQPMMEEQEFVNTYRDFEEAMIVQITERRSAVCKAACEALGEIVQYRKHEFVPFTSKALDACFQCIRQPIKVLSQSGYNLAKVIVCNVSETDDHLILTCLRRGFDGKYETVRKAVLEYTAILLETMENNKMEDDTYMDKIEKLVKDGCNDSSGNVRTQSLNTLGALGVIDEERSKRIEDQLTSAAKKRFAALKKGGNAGDSKSANRKKS